MLPIAEIQAIATRLPPPLATVAIVVAAAIACLLAGAIRARAAYVHWLPGVAYAAAGGVVFGSFLKPVPSWVRSAAMLIATVALLTDVTLHRSATEERPAKSVRWTRSSRRYLGAALALAAVLLLTDLGTYSGSLVCWEGPVTDGFAKAFIYSQGVLTYTAQRFLWDDGILSAGHTSLFYGAPTYALFHLAGFSPWALRIFAALATLLSIVVVHFLTRRFFGPSAGTAAALLFALNPAALYYGRYGSSPAGTILAVLLAVLCTWLFLAARRSAWWLAPLCAITLFLATLQYSPARLVVLILLGFILLVSLLQWRRLWWQRLLGVIIILGAAAAFWRMESAYGRAHYFVHARGETFLEMVQHPEQIESLIGRKVTDRELKLPMSLYDQVEFGAALVREVTLPQYARIISPNPKPPSHGDVVRYDPPPLPLYYAPVFLFIVWGVAVSIARLPASPHACLLLWVMLTTPPLLLTNRVDAHRCLLLLIPFSIWAAIGLREAVRVAREARLPALVGHGLAALLIATAVVSNIRLLYFPSPMQPKTADLMTAEIMGIRGPVFVGWDWDHRDIGLVQLRMLERMRREPGWKGLFLAEGTRVSLKSEGATPPAEVFVRDLYNMIENGTVLLAPADRYRAAAAALQRRGARVAERGSPSLRIIRVDRGAAVTGVPDEDLRPLPTIVIPPTPTPLPRSTGPQISLTELHPADVQFGFAAPLVNQAWSGPPISIGGVQYDLGLGMHAWTRAKYDVPPGARELQAVIGLSDTIGEDCRRASVTFEVRDQDDKLLYDSGLIDLETPPRSIRVDLRGATRITLIVTDAQDGIDCDHANWAAPAFLIETQ